MCVRVEEGERERVGRGGRRGESGCRTTLVAVFPFSFFVFVPSSAAFFLTFTRVRAAVIFSDAAHDGL